MAFTETDGTWPDLGSASFDRPTCREDDLPLHPAPGAAAAKSGARLPPWVAVPLIGLLAILAWIPFVWLGLALRALFF